MNTSNRRKNQRKLLPKEKFACANPEARGILGRLANAQIVADALSKSPISIPTPTPLSIMRLAIAELNR
jgi:hypothetical protein